MLRSMLLAGLVVATASAPPSPVAVLAAPVPERFEFASEPPQELTFEQYADLAHDAVEHVDTESPRAAAMSAAVDVWTAGADDILLREVTLWGDEAAAAAYVEQATELGIEQEFDAVESPVSGGVAFLSASSGLWTRSATWQQGRYATTIEHFSLADDAGEVLRATALALEDELETATGSAPAPPPGVEPADDAGGTSLVTFVLGVAAMVLSAVLILRFFRRRREIRAAERRLDADDVGGLIERARARTRARREVDRASFPEELDIG